MRIAQVASLTESVPDKTYGNTERVVTHLTEALIKEGHQVTLFESTHSLQHEKVTSLNDESSRLNIPYVDFLTSKKHMLNRLIDLSSHFDIVHVHIDTQPIPLHWQIDTPSVTTVHGCLDLSPSAIDFDVCQDIPLVSVLHRQRKTLPNANWKATIYNGIAKDDYQFYTEQGHYLAFVGRIAPEEGIDQAIEVALRVGIKLKIAACHDQVDADYYRQTLQPLLGHPLIEYVGEINEAEKDAFLGNAFVSLFLKDGADSIDSGMLESMACGTPIIARGCGVAAEIILNGETGYVVNSTAEAIHAVDKVDSISRQCCRYIFENRFSSSQNALDYQKVYQSLIDSKEYQQPIAV